MLGHTLARRLRSWINSQSNRLEKRRSVRTLKTPLPTSRPPWSMKVKRNAHTIYSHKSRLSDNSAKIKLSTISQISQVALITMALLMNSMTSPMSLLSLTSETQDLQSSKSYPSRTHSILICTSSSKLTNRAYKTSTTASQS